MKRSLFVISGILAAAAPVAAQSLTGAGATFPCGAVLPCGVGAGLPLGGAAGACGCRRSAVALAATAVRGSVRFSAARRGAPGDHGRQCKENETDGRPAGRDETHVS